VGNGMGIQAFEFEDIDRVKHGVKHKGHKDTLKLLCIYYVQFFVHIAVALSFKFFLL
jgi:hypothetical protein